MKRSTAVLSLVLAMGLIGSNVPFGKAIALEIPVLVFLAFRFAVASVALLVVVRGEAGRKLSTLDSRSWFEIFVLAAVGSVLFTLFILEGTKRTAAVDAGIITAMIPAAVALLGVLIMRQLPTLAQTLLIGLTVAGLAAIQSGAKSEVSVESSLFGNSLVGIAVVCEAIFVVVSQRTSAMIPPVRLSLAVSLASLALSLPLAAWAAGDFDPSTVRTTTWLIAIWYALSSSVLCTVLWYRGAAHVPTWLAGLATATVPVAAIAVSALYLGEAVSHAQLAGAALVIIAIVVGAFAETGTTKAKDQAKSK